ncbi:hypothetical protein R83H12_02169 [Fibrobacteria bacterium R8-3-H12]
MSNRVIVKFGFIAAMFVFASCHNEVPELPNPSNIQGYKKFCGYKNKDGILQCKSTYEIFVTDCEKVGGEIFCDMDCQEKFEDAPCSNLK